MLNYAVFFAILNFIHRS